MKKFTLVLFLLCTASFGADWQYATPIASPITTNAAVVIKAGVANKRNSVTGLQAVNTSATVATIVTIKDGSTVIWTGHLPLTSASLQAVPVSIEFPTPLRGSVNSDLSFVVNTTGANIFISAQGESSF